MMEKQSVLEKIHENNRRVKAKKSEKKALNGSKPSSLRVH